ncbi:MAG: helix-turn-helix domain-containing protein [Gemmataceae bacterium]
MPTKARKPLFDRLKAGLKESIAHARSELTLKTVEVPEAPPEIDAATLVALREHASMSQAVFAKLMHVSAKTVQSWEQGIRVPSNSARRLIQIFAAQPAIVCQVAGLKAVHFDDFTIKEVGKGKRHIVRRSSV